MPFSHVKTIFLKFDLEDNKAIQTEIHCLDANKTRQKNWLNKCHFKEIELLLKDVVWKRVQRKVQTKDTKTHDIVSGEKLKIGYVFKKKPFHDILMSSYTSQRVSRTDLITLKPWKLFEEKLVLYVCSEEISSCKAVSQLMKVMNDSKSSSSPGPSISNYFKSSSSEQTSTKGTVENTSKGHCDSETPIKCAPSSNSKKTVIKNLIKRSGKILSKKSKKNEKKSGKEPQQENPETIQYHPTLAAKRDKDTCIYVENIYDYVDFQNDKETLSEKNTGVCSDNNLDTNTMDSLSGSSVDSTKSYENLARNAESFEKAPNEPELNVGHVTALTAKNNLLLPDFDEEDSILPCYSFIQQLGDKNKMSGKVNITANDETTDDIKPNTSHSSRQQVCHKHFDLHDENILAKSSTTSDDSDLEQQQRHSKSKNLKKSGRSQGNIKRKQSSPLEIGEEELPKLSNSQSKRRKVLSEASEFTNKAVGSERGTMCPDIVEEIPVLSTHHRNVYEFSSEDEGVKLSPKKQKCISKKYDERIELPKLSSSRLRKLPFTSKKSKQVTLNFFSKKRSKETEYEGLSEDEDDDIADETFDCVLLEQLSDVPKVKSEVSQEMKRDIHMRKDVSELDKEQLQFLVLENRSYLKDIFRGKISCDRHEKYKLGGLQRKNLNYQVHLGLFTEEQQDTVMEELMKIFCKKHHKFLEYVMKVLLPEMLIRIYMEVHNSTHSQTEQIMKDVLKKPGIIHF